MRNNKSAEATPKKSSGFLTGKLSSLYDSFTNVISGTSQPQPQPQIVPIQPAPITPPNPAPAPLSVETSVPVSLWAGAIETEEKIVQLAPTRVSPEQKITKVTEAQQEKITALQLRISKDRESASQCFAKKTIVQITAIEERILDFVDGEQNTTLSGETLARQLSLLEDEVSEIEKKLEERDVLFTQMEELQQKLIKIDLSQEKQIITKYLPMQRKFNFDLLNQSIIKWRSFSRQNYSIYTNDYLNGELKRLQEVVRQTEDVSNIVVKLNTIETNKASLTKHYTEVSEKIVSLQRIIQQIKSSCSVDSNFNSIEEKLHSLDAMQEKIQQILAMELVIESLDSYELALNDNIKSFGTIKDIGTNVRGDLTAFINQQKELAEQNLKNLDLEICEKPMELVPALQDASVKKSTYDLSKQQEIKQDFILKLQKGLRMMVASIADGSFLLNAKQTFYDENRKLLYNAETKDVLACTLLNAFVRLLLTLEIQSSIPAEVWTREFLYISKANTEHLRFLTAIEEHRKTVTTDIKQKAAALSNPADLAVLASAIRKIPQEIVEKEKEFDEKVNKFVLIIGEAIDKAILFNVDRIFAVEYSSYEAAYNATKQKITETVSNKFLKNFILKFLEEQFAGFAEDIALVRQEHTQVIQQEYQEITARTAKIQESIQFWQCLLQLLEHPITSTDGSVDREYKVRFNNKNIYFKIKPSAEKYDIFTALGLNQEEAIARLKSSTVDQTLIIAEMRTIFFTDKFPEELQKELGFYRLKQDYENACKTCEDNLQMLKQEYNTTITSDRLEGSLEDLLLRFSVQPIPTFLSGKVLTTGMALSKPEMTFNQKIMQLKAKFILPIEQQINDFCVRHLSKYIDATFAQDRGLTFIPNVDANGKPKLMGKLDALAKLYNIPVYIWRFSETGESVLMHRYGDPQRALHLISAQLEAKIVGELDVVREETGLASAPKLEEPAPTPAQV